MKLNAFVLFINFYYLIYIINNIYNYIIIKLNYFS